MQPVRWLSELCDRYLPDTIFEMKKSYSHITPLGTMNFVTTLVNILEGVLKPENLSNKADQALFEMYFVFACIWAFGGALVEKDGINYRRNFDKWWKQTWTTVKFPGEPACRFLLVRVVSMTHMTCTWMGMVGCVDEGAVGVCTPTVPAGKPQLRTAHTSPCLIQLVNLSLPCPPCTQARAACTTTLSTPRPPSSSPGLSW